jgi:hypothetical protein
MAGVVVGGFNPPPPKKKKVGWGEGGRMWGRPMKTGK